MIPSPPVLERNILRYLFGVTTQTFARWIIRPLQPRRPLDQVVEVTRLEQRFPQIPPAFDGYRIVQLTDLHLGTWIDEERLSQLVPIVNALDADLIAVTGDLISYLAAGIIDHLIPFFQTLQARDGIFCVRGNHDCWAGDPHFRSVLNKSGVGFLDNRVVPVHREGQTIHVCGLDTAYYRLDRIGDVLSDLPENCAALLLAHEPDTAAAASRTGRFTLQLSGHSHGGQINLPGIGSPWLPRLGRRYPRGLYRLNSMCLYTCRGIGTSSLPVRIDCPPEIALFTLSTEYSPEMKNS